MKFYTALRISELMLHRTTRVNLVSIVLNKRSQIQKSTYYSISCIQSFVKKQN